MNILQKSTLVLTITGAINWGLVGLFKFDLVRWMFGDMTTLTRIIYGIIGLAAIVNIALFFIDLDGDKKVEVHNHR